MAAADEVQENSDGRDPSVEVEHAPSHKENGIKLKDLKVSDLKHELEKRDLDKNGVKSVLVERLKAAVIEEGKNPEEYSFEISSDSASKKNEISSDSTRRKTEVSSDATADKIEISSDAPKDQIEISSDAVGDKIEISSNSTTNKTPEKRNETIHTNGTVDIDDANNNEEKQEVALQLSIDEEEAQLNEESLIEIAKQPDVENSKTDDSEQLDKGVAITTENLDASKQAVCPKADNEEQLEKKIAKPPLPNKSAECSSTVSHKVVKVIGKSDKLGPTVLAKSLWITGLPNTTRAGDLKDLFSLQGRVLSVKIVKSAKQTPGKCYGFVTMAASKDATKAIQNLHHTELNGHVISVERKQCEPSTLIKKGDSKALTSATKKLVVKKDAPTQKQVTNEKTADDVTTKDSKKIESKVDEKKTSSESSGKKSEKVSSAEKSKDRKPRERKDAPRTSRRPANSRPRTYGNADRSRNSNFRRPFGRRPFQSQSGNGPSFRSRSNVRPQQRLREERFQRERLREKREAERRRIDELTRHRFIERKQREEAYRLEREKERLRIEREFLERERMEIIKLEREKQRLEREKLERERDELRRQAEFRNVKRPFSRIDRDPEPLWDERKKAASRYDVRPGLHAEAPTGSRFEFPPRIRTNFPARERAVFGREFPRHQDRFNSEKQLDALPRSEFADRAVRTRDERQVFNRSNFRDRDNRRSLSSREPERNSAASRREVPRNDWKQDRRVHERVPSSSSSGQRRLNYF